MWERFMIDSPRGVYEVYTTGQGKPVCVTHLYSAFNENGNLFASKFTKHHQVFLVNLTGCGNSRAACSDDEYCMEDSVKDLEAVRESLGIEQWIFAGHSTGGMLGLKYAIMYPDRLEKIIVGGLCPSAEYMNHKDSIYCRANPNNKRILEILALLGNPETTIEKRREVNKEWSLMSLYNEQAYEEMVSRPNSGKTVSPRLDYYSYKELPSYDLREELKTVGVQAFVYAGKYDAQCPYEYGVETAELMPNAQFQPFLRSNHFPFIEEEEAFEEFVERALYEGIKS